jgi:hypothetical protein
MKIKLIHFNFLSENSDTDSFNFLSLQARMRLWASVLTEFLFNCLMFISVASKNLPRKFNFKVLDIFSDIPVGGKLFQRRSNFRADKPPSCISAFLIRVASVFLRIKKTFAIIPKELVFFKKTCLEFTFFCRKPEVDSFILSFNNFDAITPYLLYRKI